MKFEVGHRVIVTNYRDPNDLNGYFGHVSLRANLAESGRSAVNPCSTPLAASGTADGSTLYCCYERVILGMLTPIELIRAGHGDIVLTEVKYLTGSAW